MIAEKEYSCKTSFGDEEKISRIKKAGEWGSKLIHLQSLPPGRRIHVRLELYILQGRQAVLELRLKPGSIEARKSKDDAIEGIDKSLDELKKEDPMRYDENEALARVWRACFI